jgi:hypothetical protein
MYKIIFLNGTEKPKTYLGIEICMWLSEFLKISQAVGRGLLG